LVHNTLIASGPDFRRGETSAIPSANIDLAPTVLHILGIEPPHKFDGRILAEAMEGRSTKIEPMSKTLEAHRKFPSGEWRQYLNISFVGETRYIDEGNGRLFSNVFLFLFLSIAACHTVAENIRNTVVFS
jgi:arylsulfatase A-like enzyme